MKIPVAVGLAALVTCATHPVAQAQEVVPLAALGEFGYQTLVEGAPSRSGFPPSYDCPEVRRHVLGEPWNEWTRDNLPDGCRDVTPKVDRAAPHSRFELRTYFDVGTFGWDNNYGRIIPSLVGFHVSFATFGGWKLGAGGLLVSFSPMFDLQAGVPRYQVSPRLNLFNLNRKVKTLSVIPADLYVSVEATRELFLPLESAERSTEGGEQFNNVFFGFALSQHAK